MVVVANLAATSEGCLLLLRSPLLAKTEQQLHHLLQRRDGSRIAALLEPLVNLAAHAEGQKQILRSASAPGQLLTFALVLIRGVIGTVPVSESALHAASLCSHTWHS